MNFNNNKEIVKNRAIIYAFIFCNLFIFFASFEAHYRFPQIFKYIASVLVLVNLYIFFRKADWLKLKSVFLRFNRIWFFIISVFLLVNAVRFEVFFIQELFAERFFFLPYFLPLIFISIRYSIFTFRGMLYLTYRFLPFAIIALIFLIVFPDFYIYPLNIFIVLTFSFVNSLLLYVSHLLKWKFVTIMSIAYHILYMIVLASAGRRGETLEQFLPLFVFLFIRIRTSSISSLKKMSLVFFSSVSLIVGGSYVYKISDQVALFQRGLNKEGFDQTRGETVINFLYDFGSRPNDYLIGRGLNGTFQKWSFGTFEEKYSRSIEIGYFNILLKGGYLYLIPMMLLFLSSFYLGIFRSKNDLIKGLAFLVLWQIIYMVSFGMANFSVYYFMVWIAVAACLDRNARLYDNNYISNILNSK